VDAIGNYTPMNIYKARLAKFSVLRKELHDSLPLCNWMFPWLVSPVKGRDYRGDNGLEAKFYSAVTGDGKSEQELDLVAERIFNLHRCLTIRQMKTRNMRKEHDQLPPWAFEDEQGRKPFTPGSMAMDKKDMEKARDMFYEVCGWDKETGAPTKETLVKLGLEDVAAELEKSGLLG
jgi:aldehyde:ferredoxin oxidoreductase